MDYHLSESVERNEIAKEDIILNQQVVNPDSKAKTLQKTLIKSGNGVAAHIFLNFNYETNNNLTEEQLYSISNAIKALMLLKGEECVDERLIVKFIKKTTGIKVNNLIITKATKTYSYSYRGIGTFVSDEIDLALTLSKNV